MCGTGYKVRINKQENSTARIRGSNLDAVGAAVVEVDLEAVVVAPPRPLNGVRPFLAAKATFLGFSSRKKR